MNVYKVNFKYRNWENGEVEYDESNFVCLQNAMREATIASTAEDILDSVDVLDAMTGEVHACFKNGIISWQCPYLAYNADTKEWYFSY